MNQKPYSAIDIFGRTVLYFCLFTFFVGIVIYFELKLLMLGERGDPLVIPLAWGFFYFLPAIAGLPATIVISILLSRKDIENEELPNYNPNYDFLKFLYAFIFVIYYNITQLLVYFFQDIFLVQPYAVRMLLMIAWGTMPSVFCYIAYNAIERCRSRRITS